MSFAEVIAHSVCNGRQDGVGISAVTYQWREWAEVRFKSG